MTGNPDPFPFQAVIRKNGLHPLDIFRLMPDADHHRVLQIVHIRFFL